MDVRIQAARENHRLSIESEATAKLYRDQRDHLVRCLRAEDPKAWSLGKLAREVGCSKELVAYILRTTVDGTVLESAAPGA